MNIVNALCLIVRRCSPIQSHHLKVQIEEKHAEGNEQNKANAQHNFVVCQELYESSNRYRNDTVIQDQAHCEENYHTIYRNRLQHRIFKIN